MVPAFEFKTHPGDFYPKNKTVLHKLYDEKKIIFFHQLVLFALLISHYKNSDINLDNTESCMPSLYRQSSFLDIEFKHLDNKQAN